MSNKTETNITLERIKELKGNDSQEVFAQKIHTTQSNISKMLKGMTPPSAATLTELAKTYHVSVDWLLELSDEIEIVDIINEKFKTENVKVKARKLVTSFSGFYYSENKNILFRID